MLHPKLHLGTLTSRHSQSGSANLVIRINCLAALSKCSHLQCLNLKWVSEGIPLFYLLRSIQNLDRLVTLHLPRAASRATSIHQGSEPSAKWPENLRELHFNGNFFEDNSRFLNTILPSTSVMYIEQSLCPSHQLLESFFEKKGSQLQFLRLGISQQQADQYHADLMFFQVLGYHCVHVQHLSMNLELIVENWQLVFPLYTKGELQPPFSSVKVLEIDCLSNSDDWISNTNLQKLSDIIFDPSTMPPKLRKILLHKKLNWTAPKLKSHILADIDSFFKALAREDGENAWISENEAGVAFLGV